MMPVKMADNVKYSRWTSGRTNGVSRTVSKRHDSVEAALAEAARLPECAV
ncbi:MAG: hypothetical protein KGO96_10685 [Elusimicrobia bacterium]|nr:hypothetical protein [Elusimicrobiota bacterium]